MVLIMLSTLAFSNSFSHSVNTKVDKATIYLNRALVNSTASVQLNKGLNQVTIMGLSAYTNDNTYEIKLGNKAQMVSMTPSVNYLNEEQEVSPKIKKLKKRKEEIQQEINQIDNLIESLTEQMNVISKNTLMGQDQSRTPESITALASFVQKETVRIKSLQVHEKNKQELLQKELQKIEKQLNEERAIANLLCKELVLEIEAKETHLCLISLNYILGNVYWIPSYDIRANADQKSVEIVYKAEVVQASGMHWENVQLSLSSFRPRSNQNRPILSPERVGSQMPNEIEKEDLKIKAVSNSFQMLRDKVHVEEKAEAIMETNFVMVDMNQVGLVYDLSSPKSLPSSTKAQTITLQNRNVEAKYRHHVVPKITTDVYLLANIQNWQDLSLLYGKAQIYYENSYMGTTIIDPNYTKAEFPISLGVDERIVAERRDVKDYENEQILRKTDKLYHFEIKIKNNSHQAIKLEVLDQLPLSNKNNVEVTPLNTSGVTADDNGTLLWVRDVESGKEENITLKYSIKYPKGEELYFK